MSEFEPKYAASTDPQLDVLIAEVESKFIDAEDALSELRHAVRRLKSYRPPSTAAAAHSAASAEADAPAALDAEPGASMLGQEQAVREEVSRIVAETRTETQGVSRPKLDEETVGVPFWPGPKRAEPAEEKFHLVENYGMDSTSEASWPVAKPGGPIAEPAWAGTEPVDVAPVTHDVVEADAADDDDEARREEVARIVAQMRDGRDDEDESPADQAPSEDDGGEAKRREVARMVAQLRDSVDVEAEPSENGSVPSEGDEEGRREEVARMVAEMRNGKLESEPDADHAEETDAETPETDIDEVVAQTREIDAEESSDEEEPAPQDDESDEQVRDEVRRAVEAARAELATGYTDSDENRAAGEKRFSFPDWQTTHMEPSGPPVIVIKDSEGRVELARVYETLSRVDCDENAALLNYTPHSVTVGLNSKASVPQVEALTEAVRSVFGRACEVDSDGVRVNVQIGKDLKGKDSAA